MIGMFDSGVGGLTVLSAYRRLSGRADILFFADRKHAPYGTKSEEELLFLVRKNIRDLCARGCSRVLIACCTAGTVWEKLPPEDRRVSVPILAPTAEAAVRATKNRRIGILATDRTCQSGVFAAKIHEALPYATVISHPAPDLVTMVERGARDGAVCGRDLSLLRSVLSVFSGTGIDTLILGCTHFPHLCATIGGLLPGVRLISSSEEGARALCELEKNDRSPGTGKTVCL